MSWFLWMSRLLLHYTTAAASSGRIGKSSDQVMSVSTDEFRLCIACP